MEITVVREENKSAFAPLMPEAIWQEADLVLGAVEEDTACGVLAVQAEDTLFNMQYIYVDEEFRRKGLGTALLETLHQVAVQCSVDASYCQYTEEEDMAALTEWLRKNLFEREDADSTVYRVLFKDFAVKLFDREPRVREGSLMPLSGVTSGMWNVFADRIVKQSEGENELKLERKEVYDQETSFLLVRQNEPVGGVLFRKTEESYILSCLCVLGNVSPLEMMGLLQASYQVLKKICAQDTEILINALTETSRKMVLDLTEGKAEPLGTAAAWYYVY